MSSRNQIIIDTKESKALKSLRIKSDLSLRKLADLMGYSFGRVHQFEQGREEINDEYLIKFLSALGFKMTDWYQEIGEDTESIEKRELAQSLIVDMDSRKLDVIIGMLQGLK
jgi:transcriptional regulator with XRE-family HTH domain